MTFRLQWFLCFCVLACGVARAQKYEIAPTAGYLRIGRAVLGSISPETPQDNDTRLKSNVAYGVRLTWNPWNYYGHELTYLYSRSTLTSAVRTTDDPLGTVQSARVNIQMLSYNFMMYLMPRNEKWRPFFTGGLQTLKFSHPNITDFPAGLERHYGGNYGVGVKMRLIPHLHVRLDFRDYIGGKPYDLPFQDPTKSGGILHELEGSLGLSFAF